MAIPRKQAPTCPIEMTINVIAARWKAMIVYQLLEAERRSYGELRNLVEGVTDRVLTTQLAELVADGVVSSRRNGRLVHYRLTAQGRELRPIFAAMKSWGEARQAEQAQDLRRIEPEAGMDAGQEVR
ncbi:MAG: helix-turn-helix transcriptional regulator [Bryobacteraceae bacterium]|nr:helix-turn-helix transcriptional regulator [Bryobacteraceae bacterium]